MLHRDVDASHTGHDHSSLAKSSRNAGEADNNGDKTPSPNLPAAVGPHIIDDISTNYDRYSPFIQVVRREIGEFRSKSPPIGMIIRELLKVEPRFLDRFGFSHFVQFIPFAQKELDLKLSLTPDKSNITIRFRDESNVWLSPRRHFTISYDHQLKEIPQTLKRWYVTGDNIRKIGNLSRPRNHYRPLISALSSLAKGINWLDHQALKQSLLALDPYFFINCSIPSMQYYLACAY